MKTSPNLGLTYPDADTDAFDQLVYTAAFDLIDQLLGAPLAFAEVAVAANFPVDGSIATIVQTPLTNLPAKPLAITCYLPKFSSAQNSNETSLYVYDDTAGVSKGKVGGAAISNSAGATQFLGVPFCARIRVVPPAAGNRQYSLRGQSPGGQGAYFAGPGDGTGNGYAKGFIAVSLWK